MAEQCRFWLSQGGCNRPDTCTMGKHDPEFKGKGGKGAPPVKGKGKGKGKDGGRGNRQNDSNKPPAAAAAEKLPADAIKDAKGRFLCYAYVHGKCTDPCPKNRYHGPETKAMREKRIIDEKKMKERAAAGAAGTQSEVEGGSGNEGPKPKPKNKAKAQPQK